MSTKHNAGPHGHTYIEYFV